MLGVDKSTKSKKPLVIGLALVAGAVIVALLIWYFVSASGEKRQLSQEAAEVAQQLEEQQRTAQAVDTIVSPPSLTVENVTPETNPLAEKVPEVNPVVRANPFTDEYENPFE